MSNKHIESTEALTPSELIRYEALKQELHERLDLANSELYRAGKIARAIRDERLYRDEYPTFELFCKEEMGKGRRIINRIIQAQGIIDVLLEEGFPQEGVPESERALRYLGEFSPPDMKNIYSQAQKLAASRGKIKVDPKSIRDAAKTVLGSERQRDKQKKELFQRFKHILRMLKLTFGWGDFLPEEVIKLRNDLAEIIVLAQEHLASIPKEFLNKKDE